ncbi:peptide-methionine (S)-S-oxide reductase MsrA [Ahrensia sp. R2A130]|uniref:peptide-methionine (S)-S-oxide reductase MsrA n=1 Tax=Ahrensia sp. R2A130 TaxID=744979 RepID=UPI0001E0C39D|nr:peptide-methionine (S)-S-oxide reductase MsrA [Ahrensia sp. R2A130]EFL87848.1 peptide-methionine (S)-S-oxide reductase [Ahrensia sp. R2A130]
MFLIDRLTSKMKMPTSDTALPGRTNAIPTADTHFVNGRSITAEVPEGMEEVYVGMGCFWGVERLFWEQQGVWVSAVGYQGGATPNPTYNEVCTGLTGHNETVRVVFDPAEISFDALMKLFWETHDPTQGMRQGNDTGTQYRSGIYTTSATQKAAAEASRDAYQAELTKAGRGTITTEITDAPEFFYAEESHQQYLAKNPGGYCNLGGVGVACPAPALTA